MVAADTFTKYVRRMAATQGCSYITIAETPHPIRQLDPAALYARAEAMLPAVIAGLTMQAEEIERRIREIADQKAGPNSVRSGTSV